MAGKSLRNSQSANEPSPAIAPAVLISELARLSAWTGPI
jgi:hypothetical protein